MIPYMDNADVVKFGDKHKNKHVGDHSYACTVEESGALHNKNNEKSIISNPQIEQGEQDCVIEDGVFVVAKYLYLNQINLLLPEFPWP
jgi:hypothetical protein